MYLILNIVKYSLYTKYIIIYTHLNVCYLNCHDINIIKCINKIFIH